MPEAAVAPPPPSPSPTPPTSPLPKMATPTPTAVPKSAAMQRAEASLDKFTDEPEKPAEKPKADKPVEKPELKADEPTTSSDEKPKVASKGDEKGKDNPWKLLETYKSKATKLEKELADARNGSGNQPQWEQKWKASEERATAAEKRAKELSDEMRFVNYERSDEFKEQFQKPYEDAYKQAASDMSELTIEDGEGQRRKATINDLLAIARLPLGEARDRAETMFGRSSDDVMAHRRELNKLTDAHSKALEDAKGKGEERAKAHMQTIDRVRSESATLWQRYNKDAMEKYEFLKTKEGDDEHNAKLEKASKFVDGAFSSNPLDPRLSSEDRAKAIEAQAAVRNRAIAYSALKLANSRLETKLAEAEKALKEFQGSEPKSGRGKNGAAPTASANALAAATDRLAQYVT